MQHRSPCALIESLGVHTTRSRFCYATKRRCRTSNLPEHNQPHPCLYNLHHTRPDTMECRCAVTNVAQTMTTTTVVKALVKARTTATVARAACMKTLASVARGIGFVSGPAVSPELAAVSEHRLKDLLKALKECETAATTQCTSSHPSSVRAAAFEAVSRCALQYRSDLKYHDS